ncbi:cyclic peptide export ABC transporter [Pseudobacteroides cellulosolvens]|uniref:Cyclic peptide transporter n=1 Tax=Pseudobacteroides cellulosolvens ATCC 35603 = DSM 2933 TaxID=398512 RepID=A0A0L6JHK2_9FIRM|nr:cyclic peptide export ABC transporter [Pseudobacteroides cellulosolvens]KNY24962.1 cyclic peptide transporter [Pseudobacteroides cellulosolvens ATCC 35603 = DSM 2933]
MEICKLKILMFLVGLILMLPIYSAAAEQQAFQNESLKLKDSEINLIESYIDKQMKSGNIPGMSVVIVKGDSTVYEKGFGYADTKLKKPITKDTLFELGSNSKAFTALGILQLQKKGLLHLDDPVDKYLPWLHMKYQGKIAKLTIEQLLYHTSGVPFKTIGYIDADDGENALEAAIKKLVGQELDFRPGERFSYATINYDVLGLIVQKVSGQQFEAYIKNNVIKLLRMDNTYLFRSEAASHEMAFGYKIGFTRALRYDAPMYRGNTPAGYYITNAEDLSRWLKVQLGYLQPEGMDDGIILQSHIPNRTVGPCADGSSYALGWFVFQSGEGDLWHGGENPNYSSFIAFRPGENFGVAVLANMNSSYARDTGRGIVDILMGKEPPTTESDMYKNLDKVATAVICSAIFIIILILCLTIVALIETFKGVRRYQRFRIKHLLHIVTAVTSLSVFGYCLYIVPDILYGGLPWKFVCVWAPVSLVIALILLVAVVLLFFIYLILTSLFPKDKDKSLFTIAALSIASGFGNSLVIFTVNEVLNRSNDVFESGLFLYFLLGMLLYVYGQRLVRTRLITITNDLVYARRMEIVNRILGTSYQKIEEIEDGRIQAGLNNDTETISGFANIFITGITSMITLLCCFIYLGFISFYGLCLSIAVALIAASLYFFVGRSANRLWESTRDIQNIFFSFINHITAGFKELSLNRAKRSEFKNDMLYSCALYRDKRVLADMKFANVFVIGELLFTFVVGIVAFFFPILFKDIGNSSLRTYIFVYLYMTGPVHGVLNIIPNLIQMKISWKRINELIEQISIYEPDKKTPDEITVNKENIKLELKGVKYSYGDVNGDTFSVGPIDFDFHSGEITFITGGNGSGKSTLAKLLTGLYIPQQGEIRINGCKVNAQGLGQRYSAIFSDFHLFDKLYGLDYAKKGEDIVKYLRLLKMEDKVEIQDGIFSTTRLSTGQRKRLALLISYLEDKPICLFDEWAADQDPEFRRFFYQVLLQDMKKRGKCIIAITHDDRYFDVADKVLKMETGRIAEKEIHPILELTNA